MSKMSEELEKLIREYNDGGENQRGGGFADGVEACYEAMSKIWIEKAMEIRKIALNEAAMTSVPVADVEILLEALKFYKNEEKYFNYYGRAEETTIIEHDCGFKAKEAIKAYQASRGTGGVVMTTKEAVDHLVKMLNEDESYRYSWQANIAAQFQDAFARDHRHKGVHEISSDAAKNFLNLLCHDKSDTFAGDE